ncbi:hypothetical protein COLO4_22414 [Corchorus olitorius]|uniref:Uncharacterized protein n=1 Tax=Corchorus olitorius TaxID=93759 RepID=A0A1R3ILY0_9ROSI|nr:hypothetical protein COLO4_22414 [Corchorus olitorius]
MGKNDDGERKGSYFGKFKSHNSKTDSMGPIAAVVFDSMEENK